MSDQNLMPFFESVDMDQQMKSMRTFLAHSFGGPQEYKGQEMGTAHWNISIEKGLNHSHFTAMGSYIADSLNQMGLSVELIDEVMAIIENLRGEIIHH
jgi:hemoglobin